MVAAGNTFIDSMLQTIGFVNCFEDVARYPEITFTKLQQQQPDIIFLSSEPYLFKEIHFSEFQQACPNAKVMLVDGEMFSWYGSRLLKCPDYFMSLLKSCLL
jgi:ABC-type Fe3+-hydroxamate transport system substrate-binding protein